MTEAVSDIIHLNQHRLLVYFYYFLYFSRTFSFRLRRYAKPLDQILTKFPKKLQYGQKYPASATGGILNSISGLCFWQNMVFRI